MAELHFIATGALPTAPEMQEQPETETATSRTGLNALDAEEDENLDAASVKTTTTDLFSQREESSSPGPESKQHELGLEIKYPWGWSGSLYDDYDVVTVHGIRDDYKTAWTDENGAWWVKEQLFKDMFIRQIDYSYDIDEESILYEPDGIHLHAERLIGQYAEARKKLEEIETDRPIIWVCHDLGGTIVKEALFMATNNPSKYGKAAILTSAIIFLGTPHQFQSLDHLEDQLLKLIMLPGPEIRERMLSKAKELAYQVDRSNQLFLSTKILDRAVIFDIFAQNSQDSLSQAPVAHVTDTAEPKNTYQPSDPISPFPQYAHCSSLSFAAATRYRLNSTNHEDLIQGDPNREGWLSTIFNMFNRGGSPIKVDYQILQFQAKLLSLAPPTRVVDTPFDPTLPESLAVAWIYKQAPYKSFSKPGKGPRLMHLHGDGSPWVNISKLSRLFHAHYDSNTELPHESVIYFEFDKWDSRYNTMASMLAYLINALVWRFGTHSKKTITEELKFLSDTCSWSLEDLYHLYNRLRLAAPGLTLFIGCFDQCPMDQRQWFLRRTVEHQGYNDVRSRIILSTSTLDSLAVEKLPNKSRINLADCPATRESNNKQIRGLELGLVDLIRHRSVYEDFRSQLESLIEECHNAPYLGHIILTWLRRYNRGKPKSMVADIIDKLSPVTAENTVYVFVSSLTPELRPRAERIFNWVKHALEPWSPESLSEALTVHEWSNEEPSLNDLSRDDITSDIELMFGGIITVKNRDVKFSHPSFYKLPETGIDGSAEDRAAMVNSDMAAVCLRYFQLKVAQETLRRVYLQNIEGGPWDMPLDAAVISHNRISMAEYAVRFWHQHYKASGQFKPRQLVYEMFSSKESRAAWEVSFWLFSNPFSRIQRAYISTLPTLAMLGLEDLVEEGIKSEKNRPSFEKNCWFAITEGTRVGNIAIVQNLLKLVAVDEDELRAALYWAVANNDPALVNLLAEQIPDPKTFQWPENAIFRAAATGLDDLLEMMLKSGCDINKTSGDWKMSLGSIAAWRNRVSTVETLLGLEPKLKLSMKGAEGMSAITTATANGNPRIIDLLLENGAIIEVDDDSEPGLLRNAVQWGKHKVVEVIIKAGADFKANKGNKEPLLVAAADRGFRECVRVLLDNGADVNVECASGSALYKSIVGNYEDVARLLLEHDPKPDMNVTPEGQDILLIRAICTGNSELVSLLIKHNANIDVVDPNGNFCKTPLSRACAEGNLEIVKVLLDNQAGINYTGDSSDPPLFSSLYNDQEHVAEYLLQYQDVDVKWTTSDGWSAIHAGFNMENMVRKLLKRGISVDSHSSGGTPLHMAARKGYPKTIQVLLENDPKPNVDCVYSGSDDAEVGCTALQLACMHKEPECLELLLKAGANPTYKNKNGEDAIDILLHEETDSDDLQECLELLLSKPWGVKVDHTNEQGRTRLHSVGEKTPVSVVRLLVEAKAPLDTRDHTGYTPLAVAVSKGNKDVAEYLIEEGADVDVFSPGFGSILRIAVASGSLDLVKLLVDSGADCETVDPENGESLLYTALGVEDASALKNIVRYLVDEAKVPIDKPGGELVYPVIRAAYITRTDPTTGAKLLKFLIRRKVELNVADNQGRRAVHFASTSTNEEGIKILCDAGADIIVEDKLGRKPIHFAASTLSDGCVTYLLNRFKDLGIINELDHDNWTPLLWAARSGGDKSVTQLVAEGANVWARTPEWSALKLLNFADRSIQLRTAAEPHEHMRASQENNAEWDDEFHKIKAGHVKDASCKSCLVCFDHRLDIHAPDHSYKEIGPRFKKLSLSDGTGTEDEIEEGSNGSESDDEFDWERLIE
ncbi:putative ankyrin repeat protein [Nemania abortiva]|nr:putative ankyrin repeat protein [Nemania abortiva]